MNPDQPYPQAHLATAASRWAPLFPDVVDRALTAIADGRVVGVWGPMGSGKSILLQQLADRLGHRSTRIIRGVPALREMPGGASGDVPGEAPWADARDLARGSVNLVDDADEVDDLSAVRIRRAVEGAADPAVLAFTTRGRLREPLAALLDGRDAVVLRLPPLDFDTASRLMSDLLGGEVESGTVARALEWGSGTPLGVSRYALLARAQGATRTTGQLVAVDRRFTPGAPPEAPIHDVATAASERYRLPADGPAVVAVLEMVAVARTLPYSVLLDVGSSGWLRVEDAEWRAAVRALLERGVIREVRDGVPGGGVRFAHAAAEWAVRHDIDGLGRLQVLRTLRQNAGPQTRWPALAWVALVAEAVQSGLEVPGGELVDAVRTFAAATPVDESAWSEVGAALVSALPRGFAATATGDVVTVLSDVAVALHRSVDLRSVVDLLAPGAAAGHVAAAFATAFLLQDGLGDVTGATELLDDAVAAALAQGRAADASALDAGRIALLRRSGAGPAAQARAEALPATAPTTAPAPPAPPATPRFLAAESAVMRSVEAVWAGRLTEAMGRLGELSDATPGGCEAIAIQGEVLPAMAIALMAWGIRGEDGAQSSWSWLPVQEANTHAGAGMLLLDRGVAGPAQASFEQALAATVPSADAAIRPHLHRWAAAAAGRAGRHEDAARHLDLAERSGQAARALDGVLGMERARLELSAAASAPDEVLDRAVGAARAAVDSAVAAGRHLVAVNLLWELWRSGREVDLELWADQLARVDGDRAAALSALLAAIRARDGAGVAATVEMFESAGQLAGAAEAASVAAGLLLESGDRVEASRALSRMSAILDGLGPVVLPRTRLRAPDDPRLTAREREIATMAAQGMSNAAIAAHLVLSTRTIDSHMYRLLGKLGIADRRQLRLPGTTAVGSTGDLENPFRETRR
ncbi:helix-turn-helix transcriptional regulator [uncultured Dietzia sp.]|uniref:helix-turn-helix transcriptional regulator n=1 Tax=uncultured Dietzia sp. TaxID=395519 RepID=UPI002629F7AA|nr:helix-turn-helix transcriptional regulator [uncultured Dietzia sp.]